jgi:hypothetical protein
MDNEMNWSTECNYSSESECDCNYTNMTILLIDESLTAIVSIEDQTIVASEPEAVAIEDQTIVANESAIGKFILKFSFNK